MDSTFSELFYFYFQRVKKRKRKQGGIVVVAELFKKKFYEIAFFVQFFTIIIIKCKVSFSSHSSSSHYSMQGFVFISFHPFGVFSVVNINKYK